MDLVCFTPRGTGRFRAIREKGGQRRLWQGVMGLPSCWDPSRPSDLAGGGMFGTGDWRGIVEGSGGLSTGLSGPGILVIFLAASLVLVTSIFLMAWAGRDHCVPKQCKLRDLGGKHQVIFLAFLIIVLHINFFSPKVGSLLWLRVSVSVTMKGRSNPWTQTSHRVSTIGTWPVIPFLFHFSHPGIPARPSTCQRSQACFSASFALVPFRFLGKKGKRKYICLLHDLANDLQNKQTLVTMGRIVANYKTLVLHIIPS